MAYFIDSPDGKLPDWDAKDGLDCAHRPQLDGQKCEDMIVAKASNFTWLFMLQMLVFIVNFIIQLLAIIFVYSKKQFQKGSFFIMLIVLSITVVLRSVTCIFTIIVSASTQPESHAYLLSSVIALHMDYCTDYFSMMLIFFMALNRCLFFTAEKWNSRIFEGNRVGFPIVCSLIGGAVSSEIIIFTNGMVRIYRPSAGFIDYGLKRGLRYIINRIFHLFPVGAVCCYAVLFWFLKKENQKINPNDNHKKPRNRGDQKVFIQLMFTSLFYSIMSLIVELLQRVAFSVEVTQVLIGLLNVSNYLPEISLPFLLVWKSLKERKRVAVMVAPSRSHSQTNGARNE